MNDYRKSLALGGPRFVALLETANVLYRRAFAVMGMRPFDYELWSFLHQEYVTLREEAWREFRRNIQA